MHILNQRQHIAHAENARSHAVGVERLQPGEFFADTGKLDRLAGDVPYRQRSTAACITIELGQHNSGQRQRFRKCLRHIYRVLPLHRIHHEQRFDGLQGRMQFADFVHHLFVNREAARGINDQHIVIMPAREVERGLGNRHRFLVAGGREKICTDLDRDHFQLINSRRPIDVTAHQQYFLLAVFSQPLGQFAAGSGFAGALQARHQNHCGRGGGKVEIVVLLAHQRDKFAMHHTHHSLPRREAAHHFLPQRFFADARNEIAHHRQRHVGL